MTDRLSDEDLKDILSDDDAWPSCAEAHEMARELIELRSRVVELDAAASNAIGEALTLRARLSAGPVMPEVPSEVVIVASAPG